MKLSSENKLKYDILKNTIFSKFSRNNILKKLEMVDIIEESRASATDSSVSVTSDSSISMFKSINLYLDILHEIIKNEERADEIAKLATEGPSSKRPCLAGALSVALNHHLLRHLIFCSRLASSAQQDYQCKMQILLV